MPSWQVAVNIATTFAITCLAWVFFRASSVTMAVTILRKIAVDVTTTPPAFVDKRSVVWIALLLGVEWIQRAHANPLHLDHLPRPVRWAAYYATSVVMFLFAPMHYTPFIYFQF